MSSLDHQQIMSEFMDDEALETQEWLEALEAALIARVRNARTICLSA